MSTFLNRQYREWLWIAGENGKPGVSADLTAAAESTRMITDPLVELVGTNAASANSSLSAEGGIDLVTTGADNDQVILVPHELADACAWNTAGSTYRTDREAEFECGLILPSALTNMTIMAGFKTDDGPADLLLTDTGLLCFNYNTGDSDATWGVVGDVAAGSGDVDVDTGVTLVAGAAVHFKVAYDRLGVGRCYIDGQLVHSFDMTGGVDLQVPFIGVQSLDSANTATPALRVLGWRVSRGLGQAR